MDVKQFIRDFYEEVFNAHNTQAAHKYIAPGYIQHNPGVAQGLEGFVRAFDAKFRDMPPEHFQLHIRRLICEGDMIAVHLHAVGVPGEQESAVVDIYRLENGMLAEHWDVLMPLTAQQIRDGRMF